MIRSMTGYGQGSSEGAGLRITVELRGLNNRFADVRLRLPAELAGLEAALRRRVQSVVRRGRCDLTLNLERVDGSEVSLSLNRPLVESVITAMGTLRDQFGMEGNLSPGDVLSLPGALQTSGPGKDLGEEGRQVVEDALDVALEALDQERLREGAALAADLLDRVDTMLGLVAKLRPRAGEIPELVRKNLLERIETLAEGVELDPTRVAQETAFLADRSDVTEELVRLQGHLEQIRTLLASPDGEPVGKRLDFLLQEVHRETNTVNSKSVDLELSRLSLDMKAEVEKVREQVQNLE